MPRLDPRAGEGRVIDQAHLGEAGQDRGGRVLGHAVAVHGLGQLSPGPWPPGEQPQAELAGLLLRILDRASASLVSAGLARPGPIWPGLGRRFPGRPVRHRRLRQE